jgi:hypothetical protein
MPDSSSFDSERGVIRFPEPSRESPQPAPQSGEPVRDLRSFAQTGDTDDYPQRMKSNFAAGMIVLLLIAGGLWIADSLAKMQKDQDCVLSGRRGCSPVDVPLAPR